MLDEIKTDVPDDTSQTVIEPTKEEVVVETSQPEPEPEPESELEPEPETISISKEELERLKKREADAENYKNENEKYRKQGRIKDVVKPPVIENQPDADLDDGQLTLISSDFNSKKSDIIEELKEEIIGLEDSEWKKAEVLIRGSLNSFYETILSEKRYASRNEMKELVKGVIDFSKGGTQQKKEIEKARIEGAIDQQKMDEAEVSGIKSTPAKVKSSTVIVNEDDIKEAEETGGRFTPERIAEMRIRREKIAKDPQELYK